MDWPENNAFILEPSKIDEGVVYSWLKVDFEPRLKMVLFIDENTTIPSIQQNWDFIKATLKFLNKLQGSDLNHKYKDNLFGLLQWRDEGLSWGKLTMMLNYLCLTLTCHAFDHPRSQDQLELELGEGLDFISESNFLSNLGGLALGYIFIALGLGLKEFNAWMEQGYEYLDKGQLPLQISGEPFDSEKVRGKVRYFQECIEKGEFTISEQDSEWNLLEALIFVLDNNDYFSKTGGYLDKSGLKDWEKNKKLLQRQVDSIIQKWESSQHPKIVFWKENIKNPGKI